MTPAAPGTLLATLAAVGLDGAGAPPDLDTLADAEWDAALEGLVEERLTGVVFDAARRGLLELREERHEALGLAHEDAMAAALRLESLLLVVVERLDAAGLDLRVLKGPSFAYLDYPAPEVRSFADIDLLVRGDQFDAVAACLVEAGMQRRFDEPRPGFTARYGKGVCFTAPTALEVDVHRALTSGPCALAGSVDVLWERSAHVEIGGRRVPCLEREERAVSAAVHASLGSPSPRLVPLRDVAEILRHAVDLDRLLDVANGLGVEGVLARSLLVARATLGLATPLTGEAWALGYRPTRAERWMLRSYTSQERSYAGQMLAGALAVKGAGARADYLRSMAFPDRSYLAGRDASYLRRIRRAAHTARTR